MITQPALELHSEYVRMATAVNVTPRTFKAFKNKQLIIDAMAALPAPVALAKAVKAKASKVKRVVGSGLTPKQRRILRDYAAHNNALLHHAPHERWSLANLPADVLELIGVAR